jgi:hypothetical protein
MRQRPGWLSDRINSWSIPGTSAVVKLISDAGDAMDGASKSVADAIQVHYLEEIGFHLIGFLKHNHPARVRGAVTLFGNYFTWDKTFTREELFAGAAEYASKVVDIIVEWFEAGLLTLRREEGGPSGLPLPGHARPLPVGAACTATTLRRRPTPPSAERAPPASPGSRRSSSPSPASGSPTTSAR